MPSWQKCSGNGKKIFSKVRWKAYCSQAAVSKYMFKVTESNQKQVWEVLTLWE